MVKLGSYPAMPLSEARQLALELKNQIHRGIDPTVQQQQQSVPMVSEFALQEYLPWAKLNKRSWMDDESRLRREIAELIGQKPLHEVTTRDVMQVHSFVYQHHSAATANRYLPDKRPIGAQFGIRNSAILCAPPTEHTPYCQ